MENHADEVLIEAQAEERIAEQRRGTHATKAYSQWLETALKNEQESRTGGRPRLSLLRTPWTTRACRHARRNGVTGGTGTRTRRHATSHCDKMHSLRQQALSATLRNWTTELVRHTLSSINGNRGVYGWTARETCCVCRRKQSKARLKSCKRLKSL